MVVETGAIVAKRYELKQCIASGSMSNVYEAYDTALNRRVAVKVLVEDLVDKPEFVRRFNLEAQVAAGLSHPNVVGVYDQGKEENTYYIVMEYISEYTLSDILEKSQKLSKVQTIDIMKKIATGLAFIHAHGIIHQDIKPGNILISEEGEIKVTDFGISSFKLSENSNTGDLSNSFIVGTAVYFSPEQAQGKKVDIRSDLYSLGIVMYEMLTGKVPFSGSSPIDIVMKHLHEIPLLPEDMDVSLQSVIFKLLQKNPKDRYQSGEELSLALENISINS